MPEYFEVERFRVIVERRHNAVGELVTVTEATVLVKVHGETLHNVGRARPGRCAQQCAAQGPRRLFAVPADLGLVDYKVRILNTGTDAITRVTVDSEDGTGARWSTVGISDNIIEASFAALEDSIRYKLLRSGAKP